MSLATRPNVVVLVAARGHLGAGEPGDLDVLSRQVVLLREPGSGTRSTAEELFEELGVSPAILTLGSNGDPRVRPKELPPTASLFLSHVTATPQDGFILVGDSRSGLSSVAATSS